MDFFAEYVPFLFRPRALSRALGCGARMGPACTQRCKCGSLLGSVARALGGQSREIWQVPRDRFLPSQSLARQWETRISAFLLHRATPEQHSRQERRTLVCVCGPLLCVCVLLCATCGCMRCASVYLYAGTPLSTFCFFLLRLLLLLLLLLYVMSVSSHRRSSSQALYFVVATVQQQSHIKFFLL